MCRTRGLGPLEMVATEEREDEGACCLTGESGEVGVEVMKGTMGWLWLLPWLRVGW